MTWPSHILMGIALAKGFDLSLPWCVAGSLFPDLAEMLARRIVVRGKAVFVGLPQIAHRTYTHSLLFAGLCLLAGWGIFPIRSFFAGVLFGHLLLDALTVMGVPVVDGRHRRVTLFGGKIRTGSLAELVAVLALAFTTYAVAPAVKVGGLEDLYQQGVIDRYEYEKRKKALFDLLLWRHSGPPPSRHLPPSVERLLEEP
ncbi:metal-dependent hydrolase [Thermosulfurimonas dismutans]|uniref:Metal-dependent hydrolase n=1 Tax=Thermosulfurimonas dismutans TaxID=999894 RepID=A0A179D4L2_9BACT|nr:metal-dependent hydrolase [Thermosulfurimonas dismutans]OAQ21020.1 hypothetical protein TDIS_0946 [Thermosulfurimonas dismutans]